MRRDGATETTGVRARRGALDVLEIIDTMHHRPML